MHWPTKDDGHDEPMACQHTIGTPLVRCGVSLEPCPLGHISPRTVWLWVWVRCGSGGNGHWGHIKAHTDHTTMIGFRHATRGEQHHTVSGGNLGFGLREIGGDMGTKHSPRLSCIKHRCPICTASSAKENQERAHTHECPGTHIRTPSISLCAHNHPGPILCKSLGVINDQCSIFQYRWEGQFG